MSRESFARLSGVSRETLERFDLYAATLRRWNARINLVAPSTLPLVWERHFLDSAQLWSDETPTDRWLDLGSGAGFPGLVTAIMAADRGVKTQTVLVEADARKAAFLRSVSETIGIEIVVLVERAEQAPPQMADVVSARALAPLDTLLGYALRHLAPGGDCRFLKGRRYRCELTEANRRWHMSVKTTPSVTDSGSAVLTVTDIEERA